MYGIVPSLTCACWAARTHTHGRARTITHIHTAASGFPGTTFFRFLFDLIPLEPLELVLGLVLVLALGLVLGLGAGLVTVLGSVGLVLVVMVKGKLKPLGGREEE